MQWVLLPGFDGTGLLFEPFLRSLPPGIIPRVVAYPGDRVCSRDELVEIALDAIPEDAPCVLIAESFSGPIALKVASVCRRPPSAVILCASFATCPVSRGLLAVTRFFGCPLCHFRLPRWAVKRFLINGAPEEVFSLFYAAIDSVQPGVLTSRFGILRTFNDGFAPRKIGLPILYLRATRDRLVKARNAARVQERYPHVLVETIDSPHFILQTQPGIAARAISEFVARS